MLLRRGIRDVARYPLMQQLNREPCRKGARATLSAFVTNSSVLKPVSRSALRFPSFFPVLTQALIDNIEPSTEVRANVRRFASRIELQEMTGLKRSVNSRRKLPDFPEIEGANCKPLCRRNPFAEPIIADTLGTDYYCKFLSSNTCVKGAIMQAPHRDIEFYIEDNVRGRIVNTTFTL